MFLIPDEWWEIRETKKKGKGVFSRHKIPAGTIIGDYLGKVIKTEEYDLEEDQRGLYLMYYDDETCIYPELSKAGIHLINHSCAPNSWMYIYQGHTLFFAIRDIEIGEELTISYLLSPKDECCQPCPHTCSCGDAHCRGTMHMSEEAYKIWERFQKKQRTETKPMKAIIGGDLPKLSRYPKTLPIDPIIARLSNQSHNLL